jgi:exonuclease SbcC
MILLSLYLKNIRSYQELTLDFKTGTSLFEGDIGSGKSTILMAIEFALFGLGNIRGNSLLRTGENEGVVQLTFSVDEQECEVQRKLVRARTRVSQARDGCYITTAEGRLPLSPSELKPKILEILHFNEPPSPNAKSVIFTYAVFTPQEEMKAIIIDKADSRLQTLRKAFRIEDYKIATDNASLVYKEIDRKVERLKGASRGLEDDEKQLIQQETELKNEQTNVQPLKNREEHLLLRRQTIQNTLVSKRREQLKLTEVAGQIPRITVAVTRNQQEINRLEGDLQKVTDVAKRLQPEIEALKKHEKPSDKTIDMIELAIQDIQRAERNLRRHEGALNGKISEYHTVEENGTCPTCDRPVNPEEFRNKITTKELEHQQVLEQLQGLEHKREATNTLLHKMQEYEQAQEKLEHLENQFKQYLEMTQESNDRITKLRDQVKEDQAFIKQAQQDHLKLQDVNNEIQMLMKREQQTDADLREIDRALSALKARITKAAEYITELEKTIESKKTWKKQHQQLSEFVTWIQDYFVPTVATIETSVLANINDEFNDKFREWFSILVEDATKEAKIDEDFTPIIEQDGYEQDIQYLSGGEKTSVALSYRLSLNSLVQKVSAGMKSNLLILDEPTDGFSKEQLYKVRDILDELQCPQVILVSHEKELESFADHVYRVVKDNGVSEILS